MNEHLKSFNIHYYKTLEGVTELYNKRSPKVLLQSGSFKLAQLGTTALDDVIL